MIKQGYEATLHEERSIFGVELDINVPGNPDPVLVAQDVFGEVEDSMQIFVYPAGVDQEVESAASVRFNPDGSIAEGVVPDGVPGKRWDETTVSDWLERRDGK